MSGLFKGSAKRALEAPIRVTGCASCGLASGCTHPKMEPSGHGRKRILIVAEAPGEDEDRLGTQLVGQVGQYLRRTLHELGIDLDRDCRKTNSVRCRPHYNREPEPGEKAACRKHIFDEIGRGKTDVIIPLGGHALWSLLEGRWKRDNNFGITRWRGITIPDHELGAWLCPTFHPSYVQRNLDYAPAAEIIWKRDLERALALKDKPLPAMPNPDILFLKAGEIAGYLLDLWKSAQARKDQEPHVGLQPGTQEWMECWKQFPRNQQEMLQYAADPSSFMSKTIAFDYETTGLKPYKEDHKIVCCSIAEATDKAVAWMWGDMDKESLALYREVMQTLKIRKIAGNMKFEQVWTRQCCGHDVKRWYWDTVIAAKALDYRIGNSSVKFQAYTRLGVLGYDESVDPYLKAPGNDPNGFNRIMEAPRKDLLEYCAWDSVLEYQIAIKQMEEINR